MGHRVVFFFGAANVHERIHIHLHTLAKICMAMVPRGTLGCLIRSELKPLGGLLGVDDWFTGTRLGYLTISGNSNTFDEVYGRGSGYVYAM